MAAAFFTAFFAAGFLAAAFFTAFFAAGFLATFFTAFLAAGFLAAFFTAFFAAGFLAAAFFTAFFAAGFFAAAFFTAMGWLLVNGYSSVDAQLRKTPRVSDPRSTAGARRAPERMRWRPAIPRRGYRAGPPGGTARRLARSGSGG